MAHIGEIPKTMKTVPAKNILLIEDNPGDIRLMKELLKEIANFDHQLIVAENLKDGCELLKEHNIHLILLDLNLPDSSGKQTFDTVIGLTQRIPVVLVSGLNDAELSQELIKKGAQDFILKQDLNSNLLEKTIQFAILRKQAKEALKASAAELVITNKELAFQNDEKEKRAAELLIANKELAFQSEEKEKRAAELLIANKELAFQSEEKEKRAAELVIANKELAFQIELKEKRAAELVIANKELAFQNELKEKRAAELIIAKENSEEYEKKFRQIAENIDEVFWLRTNGKMNYISPSFERIWGIPCEEIYENPQLFTEKIHPDDKPVVQEIFNSTEFQDKGIFNYEYRILRNDNEVRWINVKTFPILDDSGQIIKRVGIAADTTEKYESVQKLIKAKEQAEESEQKSMSIMDNSADAIFIANQQAKYVYTNKAVSDMLGYTSEEMKSKTIADITPPNKLEEYLKFFNQVLIDGKGFAEIELLKKDGNYITTDLNTVILPDGTTYGSCRDITERKQTELELIKAKERAEKSEVELIQANKELLIVNKIHKKEIEKRKIIQTKLIESQNRFQSIAEVAGEWIWEVDANGMYTYASKMSFTLLGYTPEELVGKKYFYDSFIPEEKELSKKKAFDIFLKMENFKNFQNTNIHKNGSIIILQTSGSPIINNQNELIGYRGVDQDITKQKRTENKLRSSKERYKNFISQVSEGVYRFELNKPMPVNLPIEAQIDFMYNHSFIAECNTAFMKMYGIKELKDIIGKSQLELHRVSSNLKNREATRLFIESGYRSENNETEEPDENGEIRYYLNSSIGIVKDEHLIRQWGTQRDVTALKKSEQELIKLSSAVEQSPAIIVITDLEGGIEYVNQKFIEVTGYSFEEAIGNNPRILKSGEKPKEEYQELWETIKSGKSWNGEFHNKKKNGELYWESASISPIIDKYGNKKYFLAIKEDITEKKEMMNDLVIAKERAEESDRLKSAFLANMSHEIRTPMNGILGFSELLKEPGLTGEKRHKYIEIIEKSGERMLNIVQEIIDISKIESGQMEVKCKETHINKLLESILDLEKPDADVKGINLSLKNILPAKETIVKTDNEKLYSILTNLVKNAIKYTDKGSIKFGFKNLGNYLEFYVKDTGIGIPPDRQEAVFERFIQADIPDIQARQGAGLGLAIAKAFVEMLGGKIWVESEEGKGSTFYFTIKFHSGSESNTITKNDGRILKEDKISGKFKVLVVDDDEVSRELISIMLKNFDKEIIEAASGLEAVETCLNNADIDLILMDIKMPDMNGYEATRQIRQFNKDVVIIAQTSFALTGDKEKAIGIGCNDYITKPINKSELEALIKKYLMK